MNAEHLERRFTAIFCADVAGYSRLTGEDEEGTLRRLNAYLDAMTVSIETHGGKVLHFAGDAVLADFVSVVDALTCAVEIQRALKAQNESVSNEHKLEFRIGINLGDVIVDRNEIYGDGVNVAVRLETLAEPGASAFRDPFTTKSNTSWSLATSTWESERSKTSLNRYPPTVCCRNPTLPRHRRWGAPQEGTERPPRLKSCTLPRFLLASPSPN